MARADSPLLCHDDCLLGWQSSAGYFVQGALARVSSRRCTCDRGNFIITSVLNIHTK